jgi:hypothetical protein
VLIHASGLLRIPKWLNVSSEELFLFLLKQFPTENGRPIDPRLEAYRSRKQAEFGAEHISCYFTRRVLGIGQDTRMERGICQGLALGGVICALALSAAGSKGVSWAPLVLFAIISGLWILFMYLMPLKPP